MIQTDLQKDCDKAMALANAYLTCQGKPTYAQLEKRLDLLVKSADDVAIFIRNLQIIFKSRGVNIKEYSALLTRFLTDIERAKGVIPKALQGKLLNPEGTA